MSLFGGGSMNSDITTNNINISSDYNKISNSGIEDIMSDLRKITLEEQNVLQGDNEIDKNLYMNEKSNIIDCKKLLEDGKLIQIRTHTRFIHFPEHKHNYVELIYMCSGSTHHVINGEDIYLHQGELLFLNQNARQEIFAAKEDDIAINFIILPEFFDYALTMMWEEENLIRNFIISCLRSKGNSVNYLHFKISDVLPIQNLMKNLIWTIKNKQSNKRNINQVTMGLLFLQLMNYTDKVAVGKNNTEHELILAVYRFIEENYKNGELSDLAKQLNYDLYWMSKTIKKISGKNFTELMQAKRLNQAGYLLANTRLHIAEIGLAIGYDNLSYFHRIFKLYFGVSPKNYRNNKQPLNKNIIC